ncbi:MAG TPA: hypothetical protein DDW87_05025, partial [Firmicutes bacterium]|nr:hypothetical protein [Bacillota bacterium]
LTELDVSDCAELLVLDCRNNMLAELDVSGFEGLEQFYVSGNALTKLNASGCVSLMQLSVHDQFLEYLNVENCASLEDLDVRRQSLGELVVSGCTLLARLNCWANNLVELDLSGCTSLTFLDCGINKLTTLDVSDCEALEKLTCRDNNLTELDVSSCAPLKLLECEVNQLTELTLGVHSYLEMLRCESNRLTELDLSGLPALKELDCSSNSLTTLNVGGCSSLERLYCTYNRLHTLKVGDTASLQVLHCQGNELTFATLPRTDADQYFYTPQNVYLISGPGHVSPGENVDLTASRATSFVWYDDRGVQINIGHETEKVFTVPEDCMGRLIYCSMTHEDFPGLVLRTTPLGTIPFIRQQPSRCEVEFGKDGVFYVDAVGMEGGSLTYQWQLFIAGATWEDLDGADDYMYSVTNPGFEQHGDQYRCIVTHHKGTEEIELTSWPAVLNVVVYPRITAQPTGTIVPEEGKAEFSIQAEIDDVEGIALEYQWLRWDWSDQQWHPLEGGTSVICRVDDVAFEQNEEWYMCGLLVMYKGKDLYNTWSDMVQLQVVATPEITHQSSSASVNENDPARFQVSARAPDVQGGGRLSYQWQYRSTQKDSWVDAQGAKNARFSIKATADRHRSEYRCVVTNTREGVTSKPVYSEPMTLFLLRAEITEQPMDVLVPEGGTATFAVVASAIDEAGGWTLAYQWQLSKDGGQNWTAIDNATEAVYTIENVTLEQDGYQYRCALVQSRGDDESDEVLSRAASLTVQRVQLTFIKPTDANDELNPLNISNGSLVILRIDSGLDLAQAVTLRLDEEETESLEPDEIMYYLLPNDLEAGEHTMTVQLMAEDKSVLATGSVVFYWQSYRRGFGFGRFDFDEN